jgi:hypothetical protein
MIIIIIPIALGIWVAIDANKRGMNAPLWGILTVLLLIIGLPLYLIERKKNPIREISTKSATVESNQSSININQNKSVPNNCPQCKNPNTGNSDICEWCGSNLI